MPDPRARSFTSLWSFAILIAVACGGGAGSRQAGAGDAGSGSGGDAGGSISGSSDAGNGDAGTPAATGEVSAIVIDSLGHFIAGAVLTSRADRATTDAAGSATIHVEVGSEQAVHIAREGFAEQVRVLNLTGGTTSATMSATLIAREPAQTISAIESGGSATGRDGVKVTFPPGALVDASGRQVSGDVQMLMTPVNVADPVDHAFPGLFEGIPEGGSRAPIASFGTAELVPQQDGKKLNLGAGRTATIELPLYVDKLPDGSAVKVGDTIPLWSLDTASGVWIQEGAGTVVASAESPTGLSMRATVGHFSWWNADMKIDTAIVDLTVDVPGQTVPPGQLASIQGRVVAGSGPSWVAIATATVGQPLQLLVPAPAVTRFSVRAVLPGVVCTGTLDVAASKGATISATIHLNSCVSAPTPIITRPSDPTATNSQSALAVDIAVAGPQPDSVELFANGSLIAQFRAQFFYRVFWDTSVFSEGSYDLVARATLQGLSNDSPPVTVVVDRTPPQLRSLTPAPGSIVTAATVFKLQFTEPMNPGPFALGDAVKLAVTPIGTSTPVPVPAAVSFTSGSQVELTVQALQTPPPGTVSLTWGGLRDAADNPVAGTVAATFATPIGLSFGDLPANGPDQPLPIAVTTTGKLIVASRDGTGASTPFINVFRRDGDQWTLLGTPGENDSMAFHPRWSLALDSADVPYLAFTQAARFSTDQVIVRRFNGASWENVGPAFTLFEGRMTLQANLVLDAADRPVISLVMARTEGADTVRTDEVFRFEPASGNWVSLGIPALQPNESFGPQLAALAGGDLVFAWKERIIVDGQFIEVLRASRYDGNAWSSLGTVDSGGFVGPLTLSGGPGGPWLAYTLIVRDSFPFCASRLARFDGSSWLVAEVPVPEGHDVGGIAFALQGDVPVVVQDLGDRRAGRGFDMVARRFIGGAWETALDATPPTPPHNSRPGVPLLAAGAGAVFLSTRIGFPIGELQQLIFP